MYDKEAYQHYSDLFSRLHVKVTAGQRAPHKAILLLSVIDLIETGVIASNRIYYTRELDRQFHDNWIRYVAYLEGYSARSATPFFHMSYEPFWTLCLKEGCNRTEKELADAISKVEPLATITSPVKPSETGDGFIPDFDSRYFKADFPYGVRILMDIGDIFDVGTPTIDSLWDWYEQAVPNFEEPEFRIQMSKEEFLSVYE